MERILGKRAKKNLSNTGAYLRSLMSEQSGNQYKHTHENTDQSVMYGYLVWLNIQDHHSGHKATLLKRNDSFSSVDDQPTRTTRIRFTVHGPADSVPDLDVSIFI